MILKPVTDDCPISVPNEIYKFKQNIFGFITVLIEPLEIFLKKVTRKSYIYVCIEMCRVVMMNQSSHQSYKMRCKITKHCRSSGVYLSSYDERLISHLRYKPQCSVKSARVRVRFTQRSIKKFQFNFCIVCICKR